VPELPEVEVVRLGLTGYLSGRRISAVEVLHPRATRRQPVGSDFGQLAGARVDDVRRRGKYLWFALDTGDAVIAHLGMSGQFRFVPPGEHHPHLRIRLTLAADATHAETECWFLDQRTFGGMQLSPGGAALPAEINHIGRDLMDPLLDLPAVITTIRHKHVGIKRVLLDQTVTSGVGNIYADEALWRARLHGDRLADGLSRAKVVELLDAVRAVFAEALAGGGTSFDEQYVNVNGESGYFDRSLAVYGQADRPCPRCGTPVRRVAFMNRSSHLCPRCQRAPRVGIR